MKLMSVCKAKGLELPVVILADPTFKAVREDVGRYIDVNRGVCAHSLLGCTPWDLVGHEETERQAEFAEADRPAYVAATRARDLLVVSALGTKEWAEGWLSPLYDDALYPGPDVHAVRPYPGFAGKHTYVGRPDKRADPWSIAPGWNIPRAGRHEVLWIDPLVLPAEPEFRPGIADVHLLGVMRLRRCPDMISGRSRGKKL
jgi:ATP-dependent helicase/nuclease subunit A